MIIICNTTKGIETSFRVPFFGSGMNVLTQKGISDIYPHMKKDKLVQIIRNLLQTDADLKFLMRLTESELETLIVCIRDRVENVRM